MDRRRMVLGIAVLMLAALACSSVSIGTNRVVGSGTPAAEPRNVGSFTSVDLAGSADVNILLGDAESINVEADDNILPLIETRVVNDTLVVGTKPNTSITIPGRVVVTVAMRSLKGVTLSGSGNLRVADMSGSELAVKLTGSGDITVEGKVDHVTIDLLGSGNIFCNELKAHAADATLNGSGTITAYADQSLNANLRGSGTIRYEGNPAQVTKSLTGSGAITP